MAVAFEVNDLHKNFGATKALDGVSLSAEEGKIFGLLGPNGAGKTTLIRVLSTLTTPDQGNATVHGIDVTKDPGEVRRTIGLAGQFAAVDEYLTGRENIYMVGMLYHLPRKVAKQRTQQLLEELGLADAADRTVKTYSGGMRRRLDLGASLVGRPKILYLDEPTTGLDPKTRLDLWRIIRQLISEGTTILLTTQYLEEADELADKIAVINRGKVIACGTSAQLKSQLGGDVIEFELKRAEDQQTALAAVHSIAQKKPILNEDGVTVTVPITGGVESLTAVVRALDKADIKPISLALHRPSLDDVFLALTGEKASETAKQSKSKSGGHT
jgi:ABC-2 type transport system ATP-binding protein